MVLKILFIQQLLACKDVLVFDVQRPADATGYDEFQRSRKGGLIFSKLYFYIIRIKNLIFKHT